MAVTTNEGEKYAYIYVSDAAENYLVQLDEQTAAAGGFAEATEGIQAFPPRAKMRRVYFKKPDGKRGSCPIANVAETVWDDVKKPFTYDGVAVDITGRTGEKFSFIKLKNASPSPSPSPSP